MNESIGNERPMIATMIYSWNIIHSRWIINNNNSVVVIAAIDDKQGKLDVLMGFPHANQKSKYSIRV